MAYSNNATTTTNVDNVTYRSNSIYANPSTGTITATTFNGTASKASKNASGNTISSTYYVKGTQTASTNAFTGVLSGVSALYEGLTIDYWLPFAGTSTAATLNLTLDSGATGAVNVYYSGTTRLTTHIGANNVMRLVYQTVTISSTSYTG